MLKVMLMTKNPGYTDYNTVAVQAPHERHRRQTTPRNSPTEKPAEPLH
jgi:hypothetical protein